jgi:hypothetical protein
MTSADCARVQAATPPAPPSITDADVQEISDVLSAANNAHAYSEFLRDPSGFTWWVRSGFGSTVNFLSLGTATHETNHLIDNLLTDTCSGDLYARYYAQGTVFKVLTHRGGTSNRIIIADTYPSALKTSRSQRYDIYVTGTAGLNGDDFSALLEEFNAYTGGAEFEYSVLTHSGLDYLRTAGYTYDANLGGTVDFMLFMQAYLQSARLNYPATYSAIVSEPSFAAYMSFAWNRAELVLANSYAYSTTATGAGGTLVPLDVLTEIYSAPMLAELDALNIPHKSAADYASTYFH